MPRKISPCGKTPNSLRNLPQEPPESIMDVIPEIVKMSRCRLRAKREMAVPFPPPTTTMFFLFILYLLLFNRHALGQITWAINVFAQDHRHMIGKKLERNCIDDRFQKLH